MAQPIYQDFLNKTGAVEIGPGIIQLNKTDFVVDIAQAAPRYLSAIKEKLNALSMEVVRLLINKDLIAIAGEPPKINIKYPRFEGSEAFSDKVLGDQSDAERNKFLRGFGEYEKRLHDFRLKKQAAEGKRIEV